MKSPYFIKSAVRSPDYPQGIMKEIALVGRSNAGKSSLLNALLGQKLAHVSQSPGKTQLINFYHWQSQCTLVDLPGYGYAKRSKAEVASWKEMVETYLGQRAQLKLLLLVIDVRRQWGEEEEQIYQFAKHYQYKLWVVLTKIDKLNRKEGQALARYWDEILKSRKLEGYFISNLEGSGLEVLQRNLLGFIKSA